MNFQIQTFAPQSKDIGLQLSRVQLTPEYAEKWNVHQNDFVVLTRNGELVNSSLYRVGGFGIDFKDKYFILLKQVESYYDDAITKDKKRKPHLAQCSCIIDQSGNEKKVFDRFENPYLVKDSIIYSVDGEYSNIETGYTYCRTNTSMVSSQFLFLENKWDKDKSKLGVLKIDKLTGEFELFT